MRVAIVLCVLAVASMASADRPLRRQQQGGFFNGLRNFFRPRRQQPPFRPPQGAVPQQQPNQFQQAQQQQQAPQPAPAQEFRAGPPAQAVQPQFAQAAVAPAPAGGCELVGPNHQWNGKNFLLTFSSKNEGCNKFTGEEADAFCVSQGGRAVSLDSNEKAEHFLGLAAQHAQRFYWTGGRLDHAAGVLSWPSGASEGWVKGTRFWSTTGGANDKGSQPDNRNQVQDGQEAETCLAVLNNFYADGIKWHDVACHHRKPTICEFP